MAKFNYNDYQQTAPVTQTSAQQPKREFKVKYFSLKNDGDEAIVRFPYTNTSELEMVTVHSVEVSPKRYKKINCLREAYDAMEKCPLCANNNRTSLRLFAKVLTYAPDEHGVIKPQACVWDRPSSFADELTEYINEYGAALPNLVFKIKRKGAAGDLKTTYKLTLASSEVYTPNIYTPDFSAFNDYPLENHFYFNKTPEEMNTFISTGSFPEIQKSSNISTQQPVQVAVQPQAPVQQVYVQPTYQAPVDATPQQTWTAPQQTATYTQPEFVTPAPVRYVTPVESAPQVQPHTRYNY